MKDIDKLLVIFSNTIQKDNGSMQLYLRLKYVQAELHALM